ncbi:putative UDP-rhamnose:rhamnosyltransferase 1 [Drosera capensis]
MANVHVVVLPWSAFGHMIPFLQLSIALAKTGVRVTYVQTPRNIQRLPRIPPSLTDLLVYKELPLEMVRGLPEETEATVDLPMEKTQYLKIAYDLLQEPFKQLVIDLSPDWIITDFIADWTVDVSRECSIPLIPFSVFNAATNCFFGPPKYLVGEGRKELRGTPESLTHPPEWFSFESAVAFRSFEAVGCHYGFYGGNATGRSDAERIAKVLQGSRLCCVRSCMEFEGEYIELYQKISEKPMIPVGVLPPERVEKKRVSFDRNWREVFKWLDEQNPKTVVFVGFGSEHKFTKDQVFEIAFGLELSELPFLWALRKPDWAVEDSDALPSGFTERTRRKGIVSLGWAPQLEILAHSSIGGSLFHSGWGSIIETLQYGHSLVVLPFIIDQGLNARQLAAKGLAIEVERKEDGSFTREAMAKALRKAMVEEEGQKMRDCARKAAAIFGDLKLHQEHYIGKFAAYLRNGSGNKKNA